MSVKEKLNQVKYLNYDISRLQQLAEIYEERSHSVPGQSFDREKVQSTRNLDAPFVKWIYKKIEVEEAIKQKQEKIELVKVEIMNLVSELESYDYQLILIYRYVHLYGWDEIASNLHISRATMFRYHKQAIDELEAKSNEL